MVRQPDSPGGRESPEPGHWSAAYDAPRRVPRRAARHGARRGWRSGLTATALIIGVVGMAASAAGVIGQLMPRTFTPAQQRKIQAWDITRRWRTLPAGKIFPARVIYQLPGYALASRGELALVASRAGIAPDARCVAVTDPAAARLLARHGCAALLRATYLDSTQSLLVTVGVAVMPTDAATDAVAAQLSQGPQPRAGLRPARFRGTLAGGFRAGQRQMSWATASGPYLILSTVGYADGRPHERVSRDRYADEEMHSLAYGIAAAVGEPLAVLPPPPRCPGSPGC